MSGGIFCRCPHGGGGGGGGGQVRLWLKHLNTAESSHIGVEKASGRIFSESIEHSVNSWGKIISSTGAFTPAWQKVSWPSSARGCVEMKCFTFGAYFKKVEPFSCKTIRE